MDWRLTLLKDTHCTAPMVKALGERWKGRCALNEAGLKKWLAGRNLVGGKRRRKTTEQGRALHKHNSLESKPRCVRDIKCCWCADLAILSLGATLNWEVSLRPPA